MKTDFHFYRPVRRVLHGESFLWVSSIVDVGCLVSVLGWINTASNALRLVSCRIWYSLSDKLWINIPRNSESFESTTVRLKWDFILQKMQTCQVFNVFFKLSVIPKFARQTLLWPLNFSISLRTLIRHMRHVFLRIYIFLLSLYLNVIHVSSTSRILHWFIFKIYHIFREKPK